MQLKDFEHRGSALKALIDDFRQGRMPSALLISGEKGIGKKTLSMLLAKGLLCRAEGERPCCSCRSCRRVDEMNHSDLLTPADSKKKSIGVEELRRILDALSRHAFEGGARVVLLQQAHRMTPQAQNCILKSLQESAQGTYFILVADQESAILPTIRSRCRLLHMGVLGTREVADALCLQGTPRDMAQKAAEDSAGSIGTAMQLLKDESYWQVKEIFDSTFVQISAGSGVPACAKQLKDTKDRASLILDIFDRFLSRGIRDRSALPSVWSRADEASLLRLRMSVLEARKQLNSNVGWAAVSEMLLLSVLKEKSQWQK